MECLCKAYIFHEIVVQPAVRHPPRLSSADQFLDSLVRGIFIWDCDVFLEELVILGFCAVENRPMSCCELSLAMADVCVVDPHVFVYVKKRSVQVARSQVSVVLRIVDDEKIPVVFEHPMAFLCPDNTPRDILLEFFGVGY